MKKNKEIIAVINEGKTTIYENNRVQDFSDHSGIFLEYCYDCDKWYCLDCCNSNECKEHYMFYIFIERTSTYDSLLYNFGECLCLHRFTNLPIVVKQENFDINDITQKFLETKAFIQQLNSRLIKKCFKKYHRFYRELYPQLEIKSNLIFLQKEKENFQSDILNLFSSIIEQYNKKTEHCLLYQKILSSVDFYKCNMISTIHCGIEVEQMVKFVLTGYFGVRHKQITRISPIIDLLNIYTLKLFNSDIFSFSYFSDSRNFVIFYNLKSNKNFLLHFPCPSKTLYAYLWKIIQIDKEVFILVHPSKLYFFKLIDNDEDFSYHLIKKISFTKRKIYLPINISSNRFGLFNYIGNQFALSLFSYPYQHFSDILIETNKNVRSVFIFYEMKDKRLVFQIERYYIHFIDIFKKTDKMFKIEAGCVRTIKQMNNNCIVFISYETIILFDIMNYQTETIIRNHNAILKLSFEYLPYGMKNENIIQYIEDNQSYDYILFKLLDITNRLSENYLYYWEAHLFTQYKIYTNQILNICYPIENIRILN